MKISIEYIKYLKSELRKINLMKLEEIEFTENGEVIDIPKINIREFNFSGLSNVDFITGGAYLKCPECHNKNICLNCDYHIDEEKWFEDMIMYEKLRDQDFE